MSGETIIAIPSMDMVPMLFAQSLAMLEKPGPTAIATQINSLVYAARNALAAGAVERSADRIFWLDSDMLFPSGTLKHMSKVLDEQEGKVILTALCCKRTPPYNPCLFAELDFNEKLDCVYRMVDEIPDGLFEVEGCGFGCVLAPVECFKEVLQKFGDMFSPINGTGEDLSFCWRARQCGWKILCDPRMMIGHWGHTVVTRSYWEDYRAFQKTQEGKENG